MNRKPFYDISNMENNILEPIKLNYEPNIKSVNCFTDKELNIPEKWTNKLINQVFFIYLYFLRQLIMMLPQMKIK